MNREKFTSWKNNEDGAAIIFGLLFGLVGFGLAYSMMLSTITSLNVASTTMMQSRLQQSAETGVNEAMAMINAGYSFKTHTMANPFKGVSRITNQSTNVQTSNIHWEWWVIPFDLTNRTDCNTSGISANYNCGYYLYSKATMPSISDTATMTVRAILVPTPISTAAKTVNGAITYSANDVSLARHGIYGLNGVQIGNKVELYTYYSVDTLAGAPLPKLSSESSNKFSLATNSSLLITNPSFTDARIAAYNLYRTGDFVDGSPQYSTCLFSGKVCNDTKLNKQAYNFTLSGHNSSLTSICPTFNATVTSSSTIPQGVTCANGNVTLDSNNISGSVNNPSILIINGDLNIAPNAQININKAPHFLRIYVNGDVNWSVSANSTSNISAIIIASRSDKGNININSSLETSQINVYGVLVGNTINVSGKVALWQDLNTKYLKNSTDSVAYQFYSLEVTNSVRDNIPISIIGDVYGGEITVDSSPNYVEVGN
jgi:hypothetical protein